jgi:nitrile hydratase accessory protein
MSDVTAPNLILEVEGIPRQNGELIFEAPWQTRAFGMVMALTSSDFIEWEDFRQTLINEIGAWEHQHGRQADGWSYYERWLVTLETVLLSRGILTSDQLAAQAEAVADSVDHEHDNEHQHGHRSPG